MAGIREAASRLTAAGHTVRRCGVLVGTGMPNWSTEDILSVHVRMHKAEGELFRDVLGAGARASGPVSVQPSHLAGPRFGDKPEGEFDPPLSVSAPDEA